MTSANKGVKSKKELAAFFRSQGIQRKRVRRGKNRVRSE
jgi:hypothetical protein